MSSPADGSIGFTKPRELQVAEAAAQAGAEIIRRYYRDGVTMRSKQSFNLVSDADLESERAIVEIIRQSFPDHAVLGEELHRAAADSEHLWVIDPLDGTNNFAHHVPHFAVSIAYCQRGLPVCGVVTHPLQDDWYLAAQGQGAWHNGQRVQVAADARLDEALIGVGFYYDRDRIMEATLAAIRDLFREQIHGIRRFGGRGTRLVLRRRGSIRGLLRVRTGSLGLRRRAIVRCRGRRPGDDLRGGAAPADQDRRAGLERPAARGRAEDRAEPRRRAELPNNSQCQARGLRRPWQVARRRTMMGRCVGLARAQ